jgi:MFS family permease
MLKEIFIGRRPSDFQINPIIKAFIIAEMLLWSAWNFVTPIFAIFASNIKGGGVEIAASAFSAYLIVRVLFELISGKFLSKSGEFKKFIVTIFGMMMISLAYLGFSMTNSIQQVFLFYAVIGVGLGIASPAKNSLFSSHLDKDKETFEWGLADASVFLGMALSAVIGGFVANKYGFQLLFVIAAIVNFLGIIPYVLYIHRERKSFTERLRAYIDILIPLHR